MTDLDRRVIPALLDRAVEEAGAGGRLPPERVLAVDLGTSRPTLRQGLAVLRAWGVIAPVQGSGIRVRPRDAWSLDALPVLLANEAPSPDLRSLAAEALSLRRGLVRQIPGLVARELGPGRLDPARRAVAAAWEARDDSASFVRRDSGVVRAILAAGGARAAAWSWNAYARVAEALVDRGAEVSVSDGYRAEQEAAVSALERGDGRGAARALATHFGRLDRELLHVLPRGGSPG